MNRQQGKEKIVFMIIFLLLAFVFLYSGLQILESTIFLKNDDSVEEHVKKTITRDGIDYFPRQDIDVFLFMGIDKFGPVEDSGSYNNDGESDTIMVMVFDHTNEKIDILHLNRDTIVEMPVLSIDGKNAGTTTGQLALAHTYGSGLEDSCENTCKTVSNMLYGISIDHYIAMHMDAIAIMNDKVGGVTVQIKDDFSQVDPSLTMGTMTLKGEQAISYVRSRKGVGNELNISRMDRQKEYMDGFVSLVAEKTNSDASFWVSAYEEIDSYIITDCSVNALSEMLEDYDSYELSQIVIPKGESVKGEEYMEFYLDKDAFEKVILQMFYAPKE